VAARAVSLGQQVNGINLMRSKGGASEKSLFDLVNAYVTADGTIKARPGLVLHDTLPAGTKGQLGYAGLIHSFHHSTAALTAKHRVWILKPQTTGTNPTNGAATLAKIHRAFVFLGRIYVVAEFSDATVRHYWLEDPDAFVGSTQVSLGQFMQPTTPNGFYYEVTGAIAGGTNPPSWRPNVEMKFPSGVQNDKTVQPTEFNNFKYIIQSATGPAPSGAGNIYLTSNTEPVWPTVIGGTVTERRYVTEAQIQPGDETIPEDDDPAPPQDYGPYPPVTDDPDRTHEN
jgi:hypothetical protein